MYKNFHQVLNKNFHQVLVLMDYYKFHPHHKNHRPPPPRGRGSLAGGPHAQCPTLRAALPPPPYPPAGARGRASEHCCAPVQAGSNRACAMPGPAPSPTRPFLPESSWKNDIWVGRRRRAPSHHVVGERDWDPAAGSGFSVIPRYRKCRSQGKKRLEQPGQS